MILAALVAGAAAGGQDAAKTAVTDTYVGLRDMLHRRLTGRTDVEHVLDASETDRGVWQARLGADLAATGVDRDERAGTGGTCRHRIRKPAGRTMTCTTCHTSGHRDLFAAATIATRTPAGGGNSSTAAVLPHVITHRRAGRHLPGAGPSRRDPRRPHRPPPAPAVAAGAAVMGSVGQLRPAPPHTAVGSRSTAPRGEEPQTPTQPGKRLWSQL
ncbi:hypothetical protein [Dactylosporangium sp. NPDC048998]|uniref:hypothetical protein n=1 Tax=Dactylosporangium sp. NPDC048998 TaxID=3363976 RepID=UPI0037199948